MPFASPPEPRPAARWWRGLFIAAAALLAVAGAARPVPAQGALGRIAGLVRDERNQPVPRATVAILGGPQLGQARTDEHGQYVLGGLVPGVYELIGRKPGYAPQRRAAVGVAPGETTPLNFRLEWGDPAAGAVEVLVTDRQRRALPGATVELTATGAILARGTTDELGSQVFPGVPPGQYQVRAARPGYFPATSRVFRVRRQAVSPVTPRLARDPAQVGSLAGTVRDADGRPIADAVLRLISPTAQAQERTGPDGGYRFARLVPGPGHSLEVTASGFAAQFRGGIEIQAQRTTFLDVTLLRNTPTLGSLAGLIRDPEGRPIDGATVEITAGPAIGRQVVTPVSGAYAFAELPPGAGYALVARAPGFLPAGAAGLTVRAGRTTVADLALRRPGAPPGSFEGVVREQGSGLALSGVLAVITEGPSSGLASQTDASGRYVLPGVEPAAAYAVRFSRTGYEPLTRTGLTVNAGLVTLLNVSLAPRVVSTGSLAGRVTQLGGQPVRGARVALIAGSTSPLETTTDRDGRYAFRNLRADDDYALRVSKARYLTETRRGIEVRAGEETRVDILLRQGSQTGRILGRVVDLAQRPIAGARIRVLEGPFLPEEVLTTERGEFLLAALPRGQYTLEVSANEYQSQRRSGIVVTPRATTRVLFQLLR